MPPPITPIPLWAIEYEEEVKSYFLDNDPYTFPLLIRIEELRYEADAVLPEGCTPLADEPNTYWWQVLDHDVLYEKIEETEPPTCAFWLSNHCKGWLLPSFLFNSLILSRIQRIIQPIAKEGERNQDQPNRHGGCHHEMGVGAPGIEAIGQHAAPTGIGGLNAHAEKTERRFSRDGATHTGCHRHDQRAHGIGDNMPPHDPLGGGSNGAGALHIDGLADTHDLTADQACIARPPDQCQRAKDQDKIKPPSIKKKGIFGLGVEALKPVDNRPFKRRVNQHRHQQIGDRHGDIGEPHQKFINSPTHRAGGGANQHTEKETDPSRGKGDQRSRARTIEQPAEDITTQRVCPQPMGRGRRLKLTS